MGRAPYRKLNLSNSVQNILGDRIGYLAARFGFYRILVLSIFFFSKQSV